MLYDLLANLLFLIHIPIVIVILTGWFFPGLRILSVVIISLTLASEVFFGYCVLTRWEFLLRKKNRPLLTYDSSFISYYAYKIFGINVPAQKIKYPAIIVLIVALIVNIILLKK